MLLSLSGRGVVDVGRGEVEGWDSDLFRMVTVAVVCIEHQTSLMYRIKQKLHFKTAMTIQQYFSFLSQLLFKNIPPKKRPQLPFNLSTSLATSSTSFTNNP